MGDYEPLRLDEQKVLDKLIDQNQDLYVEVEGWGYHPNPEIKHGDKRIRIRFPMEFTKPSFILPVDSFHLKLKSRSGDLLYEETMDVNPPGPDDKVMVREGLQIDLAWDLWIEEMSDELVSKVASTQKGKEIMSVDHKTGEVTKDEE